MSVSLRTRLGRGANAVFALLGESSWAILGFFIAAIVLGLSLRYIPALNQLADTTLGQMLVGAAIYSLGLLVVITPIWVIRKTAYLKRLLGIHRLPNRSILYLPLLMWVLYMASTIVAAVLVGYLPWVDTEQAQDVGFKNLTEPSQYIIAFFALVILPPIAEELLFRGYLFGRLRERFSFWITTIFVSVAFGVVHMQWNVGVDTAVLSVFLSYLRERTGTIWASMVLHAIKNGLAYFFLFIAPLLNLQLVQ